MVLFFPWDEVLFHFIIYGIGRNASIPHRHPLTVLPCLYLVLWRPAVMLSPSWQCQRSRRHHRPSGKVKTELSSQSWTLFQTNRHPIMYCSTGLLSGYAGVTRCQSLRSKLDFVEKVYKKLTWSPLSPPLSGVIRELADWATDWGWTLSIFFEKHPGTL